MRMFGYMTFSFSLLFQNISCFSFKILFLVPQLKEFDEDELLGEEEEDEEETRFWRH